jgi:hypothetical protein
MRILVCEVLGEVAHLGVRDRQLQARAGLCVAVGQAAVVELGRGRSNAADQSDMHMCTSTLRYDVPIARNHLVEEALFGSRKQRRSRYLREALGLLSCPYDDQPPHRLYTQPARPDQIVRQTICGT